MFEAMQILWIVATMKACMNIRSTLFPPQARPSPSESRMGSWCMPPFKNRYSFFTPATHAVSGFGFKDKNGAQAWMSSYNCLDASVSVLQFGSFGSDSTCVATNSRKSAPPGEFFFGSANCSIEQIMVRVTNCIWYRASSTSIRSNFSSSS